MKPENAKIGDRIEIKEPIPLLGDKIIPTGSKGTIKRLATNDNSAAVEFDEQIVEIANWCANGTCHGSCKEGYGKYIPWDKLKLVDTPKESVVSKSPSKVGDMVRVILDWKFTTRGTGHSTLKAGKVGKVVDIVMPYSPGVKFTYGTGKLILSVSSSFLDIVPDTQDAGITWNINTGHTEVIGNSPQLTGKSDMLLATQMSMLSKLREDKRINPFTFKEATSKKPIMLSCIKLLR